MVIMSSTNLSFNKKTLTCESISTLITNEAKNDEANFNIQILCEKNAHNLFREIINLHVTSCMPNLS